MAMECQAQIDTNGRLYIPKPTREALGIKDESASLNLEVEVIRVLEE